MFRPVAVYVSVAVHDVKAAFTLIEQEPLGSVSRLRLIIQLVCQLHQLVELSLKLSVSHHSDF